MIPRAALVSISFIAAGVLWLVEAARANDLGLGQAYGSRAVEPCDAFAEDLDSVVPRGRCPRFGGRVRVDLGTHGQSQAGRGYGAAPAAVRVEDGGDPSVDALDLPRHLDSGMARSHVRVPGPDATGRFDPASAR